MTVHGFAGCEVARRSPLVGADASLLAAFSLTRTACMRMRAMRHTI